MARGKLQNMLESSVKMLKGLEDAREITSKEERAKSSMDCECSVLVSMSSASQITHTYITHYMCVCWCNCVRACVQACIHACVCIHICIHTCLCAHVCIILGESVLNAGADG